MIDAERICRELDELATFSDAPPPAVTRVMLSDTDLRARRFLSGLCDEAGLEVRCDAAGNIFARWVGSHPDRPAVATGSHADAIPHSGRFDGTVGVLCGLEAMRALRRGGYRPQRSIELILFTSEEPTRYGVGCLGSRLMAGVLDPAEAGVLTDERGESFDALRQSAGLVGKLADVKLPPGSYSSFVELHIEQGPLLERAELPIGIVTAIAAPAALRVAFQGQGGHAGAVLLPDRRDALLPAAETALAVRRIAEELGGPDTVATTGVLDVHPGAVNSIPSETYLEIDIRDIDLARRDAVLQSVQQQATSIGARHQQQTTVAVINADPPATCDSKVINAVEMACDATGYEYQSMISRAYHDSLFMALVAPTAMIFIPCKAGISHRPDEYASPDAIGAGAEVLAETLKLLAK